MNWSPKQDEALRTVEAWLRNPTKQIFRLFGPAGTGKTTLAFHFREMVSGTTLVLTYTGKAASVLRKKGCRDASTIHSKIYLPKEKSRLRLAELEQRLVEQQARHARGEYLPSDALPGTLEDAIAAERRSLAQPSFAINENSEARAARLIIVDEVSMVDSRMAADLLSFEVPILVLGDPAQLPPIGGGGYFTEAEPDILLTEIHRQARENPIIDLATRVREGEVLSHGDYGASAVLAQDDPRVRDLAMAADQMLVWKNDTRRASNLLYRKLLKRDGTYPVDGEKLVCLRNNRELGLLNGTIWYAVGDALDAGDQLIMSVRPDDAPEARPIDVEAHKHYFEGRSKDMPWWERKIAEEFDFGYSLTVHKAQGSQWNHVFVKNEMSSSHQDAKQWLYTAITRAVERVTVVR